MTGRQISIADVKCTLVYCIPCDTCELRDSYLEFDIGGKWCDTFDLFYDEEEDDLNVGGKTPSFLGTCLRPEEIFNFDVSVFKKFECLTDSSD